VSWPIAARAQQTARPVIGFLSSFSSNRRFVDAFQLGLKETGYVQGQNVEIEFRWAEGGHYDQLSKLASDLVERRVTVIVASPIPAALAVKAATTTIPIVFAVGSDPVQSGLVSRLDRPGANITGVSFLSLALSSKRLELLREVVPKVASIALLVNSSNSNANPQTEDMRSAAAALGLHVVVLRASSTDDIDAAFATIVAQRVGGLVVSADPFFFSERKKLVALAAQHTVPAIYYTREFTDDGGLMSYGSDFAEAHRQVGNYAGRILKGAKPSDLPVVLSDRFNFVLNLRSAKVLGLPLSPKLLAFVDEVIE
jgi:putative ABC transport system substrate-binding protein